jgi:hypothetical protein
MKNIHYENQRFKTHKQALVLKVFIALIFATSLLLTSCGGSKPANKAVFLLLDTSGTYTQELAKAQAIMNYLLVTLSSGDSIAIARIDSGSFSEKDIIAKATFDHRPSTANDQKRLFKHQVDEFVTHVKFGSRNTDITGGLMQAADFINETKASNKYVLIFSDLEQDLAKGHVRDFPINVKGINVVALNVTKLRSDNVDPRDYKIRQAAWQQRVELGGGNWRVVNDLERLDSLITSQ